MLKCRTRVQCLVVFRADTSIPVCSSCGVSPLFTRYTGVAFDEENLRERVDKCLFGRVIFVTTVVYVTDRASANNTCRACRFFYYFFFLTNPSLANQINNCWPSVGDEPQSSCSKRRKEFECGKIIINCNDWRPGFTCV